MEVNYPTIGKVERIFGESWDRVAKGAIPVCVAPYTEKPDPEWVWSLYMNSHDVSVLTKNELVLSFADMVNFNHSIKDRICILDPCEEGRFLLVPIGLAERCLVMETLV